MLKRKARQLGITDIEVLQGWCQKPLVPKESIYHGLAGADDIFRDELFASAYSSIG
ncbi:MAG: hypothetical protein ACOY9Y_04155 [Bacillota bacterium]